MKILQLWNQKELPPNKLGNIPDGYTYELRRYVSTLPDPRWEADIERMKILATEDDILYIDFDVTAKEWPTLQSGIPSFSHWKEVPQIWVISNKGCKGFFEQFLNLPIEDIMKECIAQRLKTDLFDKIHLIDSRCFKHKIELDI